MGAQQHGGVPQLGAVRPNVPQGFVQPAMGAPNLGGAGSQVNHLGGAPQLGTNGQHAPVQNGAGGPQLGTGGQYVSLVPTVNVRVGYLAGRLEDSSNEGLKVRRNIEEGSRTFQKHAFKL